LESEITDNQNLALMKAAIIPIMSLFYLTHAGQKLFDMRKYKVAPLKSFYVVKLW
tara:strand:- start:20 stop:184 length:165 start_codon:yes stop_codon:yes gene_type:complete